MKTTQSLMLALAVFLLATWPAIASAGFVDNGNGTVTDTSTGLMWQQDTYWDNGTWEEALAYCQGLSLAGHTDWRLPTIKELSSLTDFNHYNPAIDTTYFPSTNSMYYWSATTSAYDPGFAWMVDSGIGQEIHKTKLYSYAYFRAVRKDSGLIGVPVVTTTAVSEITSNSAASGGNINSDKGDAVTARGVCWSKSADPTTSNPHTSDGTGLGSFSSLITGLQPGVLYHLRAYATNSRGTGYGVNRTFSTHLPVAGDYQLPDTGIHKCYDADKEIPCPQPGQPFFGQDAQHNGPQLAYRDNGNGTVTDLNTGLMWQQNDDGKSRGWQEAIDYCEDLTFPPGGYSDWRLPDRRELVSIVDFGRENPPIDTTYFPNCRSSGYWSSSPVAYSSCCAWYVDFYFFNGFVYQCDKTDHNFVRCVRAGP